MKKRAVYSIIIIMLVLTSCTIGGSFYMLNFSLTPNAKILSKDADSYPYMYRNYPFLRPWVDSLKQVNALKDTFIINPQGIQLHAFDTQILESVINSFGSTSGAEDQCFFVLRL